MTTEPVWRYAVYWAPAPETAFWRGGSAWLGRCAASGQPLPQPAITQVGGEHFRRLTAAPRRYGWHATLHAPFALAPGVDVAALRDRLGSLCRKLHTFPLPKLEVVFLDDFLALVPSAPCAALAAAEAACLHAMDALRAPLPAHELARRRAPGLSALEETLLLRWGYPQVLSQFRFHLSLSGSLRDESATTRAALHAAAVRHFAAVGACEFSALSLFCEPTPGADFRYLERFDFGR